MEVLSCVALRHLREREGEREECDDYDNGSWAEMLCAKGNMLCKSNAMQRSAMSLAVCAVTKGASGSEHACGANC